MAGTYRPRADVEGHLGLVRFRGSVLRPDGTDVEDHVAAAAFEPVDKDLPARGAAPHRAGDRYLTDEQECGGRVDDGDVVHVNIALAAYPGLGVSQWGVSEDSSTYLYRTPI